MKRTAQLLAACAISLVAAAHVGSPDTYFQGAAGPYPIRVIVRNPGVVPGQAEIVVRLLAPIAISRVLVLPVFWDPRTTAPPPPDRARPVRGDSTLYQTSLWLMRSGAYGVEVTIDGDRGRGSALVPVQAVATRRLGLPTPLALLLAALGTLLLAGAMTIVGAAVRESPLAPGDRADRRRISRARGAMALSALIFGVLLWGARAWWRAVDAAYRSGLYHPRTMSATIAPSPAGRRLQVTFIYSSEDGRMWTPLIPDHGHLVHLFAVRDSTLGTFAHLHPLPIDSATYETHLPPLAAGRYRLYADVVHETGFAETLTGILDVGASSGRWRASDADDAWLDTPVGLDTAARASLADGSTLTWERAQPLVVNEDAGLRFRLRGPHDRPAALEPYMGMAGHLMLTRADGTVFVHLHPAGTISMAAQQTFLVRDRGDTISGTLARRLATLPAMAHAGPPFGDEVVFPYAFPRAGPYRLWVQVKRGGQILTGVFDAQVASAPGTPK